MKNISKTNAVRIVESLGIKHEIISYDYDDDSLSAVAVAKKLACPEEQIFKTLVTTGNNHEHFVFIIPGNSELDLKKAAKVSGNKKIDMIKLKDLVPLTGYLHGGCSPIGMKKNLPQFIDEYCLVYDQIYVSAGLRGLQLKLAPTDLINICDAQTGDLIK